MRVRTQPDWQPREFRVYFEALMFNAGIESIAQLARLADMDPSVISRWLNGHQQPSRGNLKKVAAPLKVHPPQVLYIAAGLDDEDDLDMSGQFDLSAIAPEYRELLAFDDDKATTDIERKFARQFVATFVAGMLVRRAERAGQAIGRQRSA